ncbi:DNA adenine methylase [Lactobacillus sp. AN1001]
MKREDMWLYGIPRVGGKGLKAEKIIDILPEGKRLIDLFGGGGSVSMQASLSGKYEEVIYNDQDTSLAILFEALLSYGEIDFKKFVLPERNKFFYYRDEVLDNDLDRSIVLTAWTFSNNRTAYLWGRKVHNFYETITRGLVYGDTGMKYDVLFERCAGKNLNQCKLEFQKFAWETGNDELIFKGSRGERKKRCLRQLETLARLERIHDNAPNKINNIEIFNLDYHDVEIRQDDVLFLDPPYLNTADFYRCNFDHEAFIDFYTSLPNKDIYITEYTQLPNTEIIASLRSVQGGFSVGAKKRGELLLKVIK